MNTQTLDSTENNRRVLAAQINCPPQDRAVLESRHGRAWTSAELADDFEVVGFAAPFVVVRRKTDNKFGSLLFQHHPRYYFAFQEDK